MRAIATFLLVQALIMGSAWADIPDLDGWTRSYSPKGVTFVTAADIAYTLPPRIASIWPFDVTFNREAMRAAGARGAILNRQGAMAMGAYTMDSFTVRTKSGKSLKLLVMGWEAVTGVQIAVISAPAQLPDADPRMSQAQVHAINLASARESVEP